MKTIIRNCLIGFLLLVGGIFFVLENQLGGFQAFIVSSASMEPTILTGSLAITYYTHPTKLIAGDIITFMPPTKDRDLVTHRIVKATQQQNLTTFTTKGDNNNNEDTWILAGGAIIGKVIYSLPFLGYLISFIQSKIGIFVFVLLPCVYIIVDEIYSIVSTIKNHKKSRHKNTTDQPIVAEKSLPG